MAIKIQDYEVRLVKNSDERRDVRRLRYRCFVEEEGASATAEQRELKEEWDEYDRCANFIGVFRGKQLVGTYRMIEREDAEKMGGFYTETEFNITKIKKARGNICEMSRACVAPEERENGLVMRMLWLGIGDDIAKKRISLLFGIASWTGTKSVESAHALSYLYYNHLSPLSLRAVVDADKLADDIDPRLTKMNILPPAFVDKNTALRQMTPLVRGYLRLGATFGKGVFIDQIFNSYDVFVTVQTKNITAAYQKHFTGDEDGFAELGLKTGPVKMFGKILTLPFTILGAVAKFILLPDEANDAELVEDKEE